MDKFFIPTQLYKEYIILDLIYKNNNITQRMLSNKSRVSLSMVNMYLNQYEEEGFIKINYKSRKNLEYIITPKGIERMRILNVLYLKDSQYMYDAAKSNIENFLI